MNNIQDRSNMKRSGSNLTNFKSVGNRITSLNYAVEANTRSILELRRRKADDDVIRELISSKQDTLIPGNNITIDADNRISAIDTVYDDAYIRELILGKADIAHTHVSYDIVNFNSSVRVLLFGNSPITYDSVTGEISHTNSATVRHVTDTQINAWNDKQNALNRTVIGNDNATGTVNDTGDNISIPLHVTVAAGIAANTLPSVSNISLRTWLAAARNNLAWLDANKAALNHNQDMSTVNTGQLTFSRINMSAVTINNRLLGRGATAGQAVQELDAAAVRTMLNVDQTGSARPPTSHSHSTQGQVALSALPSQAAGTVLGRRGGGLAGSPVAVTVSGGTWGGTDAAPTLTVASAFTGTLQTVTTAQTEWATAISSNAALTLHRVARTGNYTHLNNAPVIPAAHSGQSLHFRAGNTTNQLSFGVNDATSRSFRLDAGMGISITPSGDATNRIFTIASTGGGGNMSDYLHRGGDNQSNNHMTGGLSSIFNIANPTAENFKNNYHLRICSGTQATTADDAIFIGAKRRGGVCGGYIQAAHPGNLSSCTLELQPFGGHTTIGGQAYIGSSISIGGQASIREDITVGSITGSHSNLSSYAMEIVGGEGQERKLLLDRQGLTFLGARNSAWDNVPQGSWQILFEGSGTTSALVFRVNRGTNTAVNWVERLRLGYNANTWYS